MFIFSLTKNHMTLRPRRTAAAASIAATAAATATSRSRPTSSAKSKPRGQQKGKSAPASTATSTSETATSPALSAKELQLFSALQKRLTQSASTIEAEKEKGNVSLLQRGYHHSVMLSDIRKRNAEMMEEETSPENSETEKGQENPLEMLADSVSLRNSKKRKMVESDEEDITAQLDANNTFGGQNHEDPGQQNSDIGADIDGRKDLSNDSDPDDSGVPEQVNEDEDSQDDGLLTNGVCVFFLSI
jgi:hypothetical protein